MFGIINEAYVPAIGLDIIKSLCVVF